MAAAAARSFVLAALAATALWPAQAGAVVGGRPASEPYPWMASLQLERRHYCGATLVRPDWALTAAHCVDDRQAKELTLVLGRTRLSGGDGERIGVERVVQHEAFRTDPAGGHDIALLKLERTSGAATLPLVRLDQGELWAPGAAARVIGWGTSVYLVGPSSDDLMEADLEVISDEECATSYGPGGFDPDTQLCAGRRVVGLRDSCQGDSGGPLVVRDRAGAWTQVGVVSQGLGCGLAVLYGQYARLGGRVLHDWIAERLGPTANGSGSGSGGSTGDSGPAGTPAARMRPAASLRRTRRALLLRVTSTAPLTNLQATLKRGRRLLARGRLSSLQGRGTVRFAVRGVRAGRLRVRLRATDAAGRTVRASARVRLAR